MRSSILAGLCLLLVAPVKSEGGLLKLTEASFSYTLFNPGTRWYPISQLPGRNPTSMLDVNINFRISPYTYFNNTIHTMSDQSQFRTIGWEYTAGVHLSNQVDLGIYHYSQHVLDTPFPGDIPQMTGIQIKIFLYKENKTRSIF